MSYKYRLTAALDDHLTELAVIIGGANIAAGIGLASTGFHFGAINLTVGVAVAGIALYQAHTAEGDE